MQDYSRVQYLLLKKMFPCRMTILGDRAQTMEDRQQDVLEFLPRIFGKDIRIIHMNKSYRIPWRSRSMPTGSPGSRIWSCSRDTEVRYRRKNSQAEAKLLRRFWRTWQEDSERLETAAVIFYTEAEAGRLRTGLIRTPGETDGRSGFLILTATAAPSARD